jgi:flagellar biosynthesis protein FlhG
MSTLSPHPITPATDQANALRRMALDAGAAARRLAGAKLAVVISGKGGVGTTTLAVNLAVALARRSRRTVLADAAQNGGDAVRLCRVPERFTVADVLAGRQSARDALQPGPGGIEVLPGAWGLNHAGEFPPAVQDRFVDELRALGEPSDWVVVDAGSGANRMVQRLWQAAECILLVTTGDAAAVMNAYAAVKVLSPDNNVSTIRSVVNMAADEAAAAEIHLRLARACLRFLGVRVSSGGFVPEDLYVSAAAKRQEPFVLAAPNAPAARRIDALADTVLGKIEYCRF